MSSKPIVLRQCQQCGNNFLADPFKVREGKAKYCSRVCANIGQHSEQNIARRFFKHIVIPADPTMCWLWQGKRFPNGYGMFTRIRKTLLAHRFSYELHVGPIPKGLLIRHRCDNRPCVNPQHLLPGTQAQNIRDAVERGRMPHGERSTTKLTTEIVQTIRQRVAHGEVMKHVAIDMGINYRTVQNVVHRISWKYT